MTTTAEMEEAIRIKKRYGCRRENMILSYRLIVGVQCEQHSHDQQHSSAADRGKSVFYLSFNFSWRFSLKISPKSDVVGRMLVI